LHLHSLRESLTLTFHPFCYLFSKYSNHIINGYNLEARSFWGSKPLAFSFNFDAKHQLSSLNNLVHGWPSQSSIFLAYEILSHVFIFFSQRFSLQRTRHFEHHPKQNWTLKVQSSSHSKDKKTKNFNLAYKCKIHVIQFKENTKAHWYFVKANKKWLKPRLNFTYIITFKRLWNLKNIKKNIKNVWNEKLNKLSTNWCINVNKKQRIKVKSSNLARWNFWRCWRASEEGGQNFGQTCLFLQCNFV
jgi:hypothetical protein